MLIRALSIQTKIQELSKSEQMTPKFLERPNANHSNKTSGDSERKINWNEIKNR